VNILHQLEKVVSRRTRRGVSSVSRMLMQGALIAASRSLEITALTFLACSAMSDKEAVFRDRERGWRFQPP
jgi:hypothetical protein